MKNSMTTPLSSLYEEFIYLFDEPDKVILSESKATYNKEDELKKIIDDAVKGLENDKLRMLNIRGGFRFYTHLKYTNLGGAFNSYSKPQKSNP